MKGRQIVLDRLEGREAAALLEDGVLQDLLVAPPDHRPLPGAIYRALVDRPAKGQGAAFLRLTDGITGFMRHAKGLRQGTPRLVQVTGFAEARKAVPLSDRLLFKGRFAIVTPDAQGVNVSRRIRDEETRVVLRDVAAAVGLPDRLGLILRSAAAEADGDAVAAEIAALGEVAAALLSDVAGEAELLLDGPGPHDLALRDWLSADTVLLNEPGAFGRLDILEAIDALRQPEHTLDPAGRMHVQATRGFVAVDVDTGADHGMAAGLKATLAAVRALPRALRLRGLGGQVVVDPAPLPKKDRRQVDQALRAAFRACPVETTFVGWTAMGHLELQRKRERLPLSECLS